MDYYKNVVKLTPLVLLENNRQPKVDSWTDIGEAKITQTVFGKAKVRAITEQGKHRHARSLTALVVAATVAAAWLGWIASQQTEPVQSVAPPPSIIIGGQVSTPPFNYESLASSPGISPFAMSEPGAPSQTKISNPAIIQSVPHQPPGMKAPEQMAAKPIVTLPLTESKPLKAPLATNNNASNNLLDIQQPAKLPAPIKPVAPVAATPLAPPPAANKPAAVAPPVEPLIKEGISTPLPSGDNQPTAPVNAQP